MNLFVELTKLLLPIAALLVTVAIGLGAKLLREKAKNEIFGRAITTAENVVKAGIPLGNLSLGVTEDGGFGATLSRGDLESGKWQFGIGLGGKVGFSTGLQWTKVF